MNRSLFNLVAAAVAALFLQACHDKGDPTEPADTGTIAADVSLSNEDGRHIVIFAAERVPADFGERLSRLGGFLEASLDNIGVAVVTGLPESAAAELALAVDIRGRGTGPGHSPGE